MRRESDKKLKHVSDRETTTKKEITMRRETLILTLVSQHQKRYSMISVCLCLSFSLSVLPILLWWDSLMCRLIRKSSQVPRSVIASSNWHDIIMTVIIQNLFGHYSQRRREREYMNVVQHHKYQPVWSRVCCWTCDNCLSRSRQKEKQLIFMIRMRWTKHTCLNDLSQKEHLYGFSPVWIRACCASCVNSN